eukprot:TRINITY_DN11150_c0_g1_i1.p1 TRINITY_DN11150_c0_g1~~TRINITY_DN11150_c0_g1_i1.p1  ORF type:complete len:311 (+),score=24.44 TRINITY_DN11150_c0_g1_i1:33-935(+)
MEEVVEASAPTDLPHPDSPPPRPPPRSRSLLATVAALLLVMGLLQVALWTTGDGPVQGGGGGEPSQHGVGFELPEAPCHCCLWDRRIKMNYPPFVNQKPGYEYKSVYLNTDSVGSLLVALAVLVVLLLFTTIRTILAQTLSWASIAAFAELLAVAYRLYRVFQGVNSRCSLVLWQSFTPLMVSFNLLLLLLKLSTLSAPTSPTPSRGSTSESAAARYRTRLLVHVSWTRAALLLMALPRLLSPSPLSNRTGEVVPLLALLPALALGRNPLAFWSLPPPVFGLLTGVLLAHSVFLVVAHVP